MPKIKVVVKKDLYPVLKIGDKATIIPVLYEEDTLIRDEIYGVFKGNIMIKIFEQTDLRRDMTGTEIKKISDKLYAPKGSYKDSFIELENGKQYPSSLVRNYEDYFDKL